MSMDAVSRSRFTAFEQLRLGRDVLRSEGRALLGLADRLSKEFCQAVELVLSCRGHLVVCGMGKAGLVGQKLAATFSSTGTPSRFLHPSEAIHGDLGSLHQHDIILMLSHSGQSEEIVRLLPSLRELRIPIIAVTGDPQSDLAANAAVTLLLGRLQEACPLGLAPTTSTTAMIALGDALALVVSQMRGFGRDDFARFHPGGSLGRKLAKVDDLMRPLAECRVADQHRTVREILVALSRPGRRTGAIMLLDQQGLLTGIFTDSDLARLLEKKRDEALDRPILEVMTRGPRTIGSGAPLEQALAMLVECKLSELPVVDPNHYPLGLIDITDIVGLPATARDAAGSAPPLHIATPTPETISFPNPAPGTSRK